MLLSPCHLVEASYYKEEISTDEQVRTSFDGTRDFEVSSLGKLPVVDSWWICPICWQTYDEEELIEA